MIDDEVDFGDIADGPVEAQGAAKIRIKGRPKPRKPSVPSRPLVPNRNVETTDEKLGALSQDNLSQGLATNQEIASPTDLVTETVDDVEACRGTLHTPSDDVLTVSAVDTMTQNKGHNDDQSEVAAHQENLAVSDTQASSTHSTSKTVDDLADFGGLCDTHTEEEKVVKFKPKNQVKPSKAASKSRKTDQKAVASAVNVVSQNKEDSTNNLTGCDDEQAQAPTHQERVQTSDFQPPLGNDGSTVDDLSGWDDFLEEPVQEETGAKLFPKSQGKPGNVSSTVVGTSDNSAAANLKDTNDTFDLDSPDGRINPRTDDTQQTFGESLAETTAKLLPNVGWKKRRSVTFVVPNDSEVVAPTDTIPEDRNDIGTDENLSTLPQQTAQKKKSREKDPNKEPLRGSKRTSKNSTTEKPAQQNENQNKSEEPSRRRKRALKDTVTEEPEKKLTHRIRQKRTKVSEVQTLLEKPDHEIDRMKLSVTHLRLLQEARERIQSITVLSGPSSSNQSSSLYGETDDFDPFGDNYVNDRTETDAVENTAKLNYHSYMNKQTRARWTKSDTDLFYQGLQQFGSDFAMIQQLFPDKSRDQVRQKFKSEEKKHPMQVHDAILHRSRDNVYLKQVIKQLNIEELPRDINSTQKQEVASNEGDTGNENVSHVINEEEENGFNWSDEELGTHQSDVKDGEHVSVNADDDGLDDFDWY